MKKTQRTLLGMMLGSIGISLLLVLLYETDIFLSGTSTDNKSAEFLTVTFMELLTICLIPLSLRLFKFKHIHRQGLQTVGWGHVAHGDALSAHDGQHAVVLSFHECGFRVYGINRSDKSYIHLPQHAKMHI